MEKEEFKKIIAYQIYKRRMDKGWTQAELADFAQLSQGSIQFYETRVSIPSSFALCKIADALGCSIEDLCGRSNDG